MAKKITIDIEVNGKMQKATLSAKKLRSALDDVDTASQGVEKGSRTLDRNLKGAARTTSNSTKEFSKMAQGMGGLVGAYATVAASVFALSAAFQFLKTTSDLAALTAGQELFAAKTGVSMKLMTQNIQAATGGLVAFKDAAQAAAIGEAAGLSADQMERLGAVAKNAGTILGRDVTDSFNRLTRGAIKAEPELLDELGIIVRINDAAETYARTIGKSAQDLTQFEKSQAVVNAVLEQGESKFDDVGDSINSVAQFAAAFQDTFKDLSKPIAEVANFIAKALSDSILGVSSILGILGLNIVKSFAPAGPALKNTAEEGVAARKRLTEAVVQGTKKGIAAEIRQGNFSETNLKAMERAHDQKTSKVIDLSRTEKAAIQRDVYIIRAQTLRMTSENAGAWTRMINGWRAQLYMFQADYGRTMGALKATTAVLSAAVGKLFGALSFVGLIVILVELGKQFRRTFMISDDLRKAEEATEKLSKRLKEQSKAIDEVTGSLRKPTDLLNGLNQQLGVLSNFNFAPVIAQINGLEAAVDRLAEAEERRKKNRQKVGIEDVPDADSKIPLMDLGEKSRLGVETFGQLNKALATSYTESEQAKKALNGFKKDLGLFNYVIANVSGAFEEHNSKIRRYQELAMVATRNRVKIGLSTDEAEQVDTYLKGLQESVPLVSKFIDEANKTPLNLSFDKEEIRELEEQIISLRGSLRVSGVDKAAVLEELEALGTRYRALIKDSEDFQKKSAALGASFQGIVNATQQFREGSQNFMPKESQFTAVFTALDQISLNIQNIIRDAGELGNINIGEMITAEDGKYGEEIQGIEAAYKVALKGLKNQEEFNEEKFKSLTLDEINNVILEKRRVLTDRYATLERDAASAKIEMLEASRRILPYQQGAFNALKATVDAEQKLKEAQAAKLTLEETTLLVSQEQKDAADEKIALAKKELEIAQQREALERRLLPIKKELDTLSRETQRLNAMKQIVAEERKIASMRKEMLSLDKKMAEDKIQEELDSIANRNPFFDKELAMAEAKVTIAEAFLKQEKEQVQQNYDLKVKEINNEYDLLEAKRKQSILQLKVSAAEARDKGGPEAEGIAKEFEAIAQLYNEIDYTTPRETALLLADKTREASLYGLEKTVRDARRAVEELDPMDQVLDKAADAFRGGLNDAINGVFDAMVDGTKSMSDALKDAAKSVLQTIQKEVTQRLIVDPLLNAFFGEDPKTTAIANAHTSGMAAGVTQINAANAQANTNTKTTLTTGANQMKTALSTGAADLKNNIINALNTGVKIQCCDKAPEPPLDPTAIVKDPSEALKEITVDAKRVPEIYEGGSGTSVVKASDPAGPMEEVVVKGLNIKSLKGAFKNFTGAFSDIFDKNIEGGFIEKLGIAFEAGGGLFSSLFKSLPNLFSNLFGGLFGGGAGGGGFGQMLGSAIGSIFGPVGGAIGGALGGMLGFGDGGITPKLGYASGGVARGPKSGYAAVLHGNEAVVPLPDGNRIPVDLKGAGSSQQNNVTVNVSIDGNGGVSQRSNGDQQGMDLGKVIANAVQTELMNQKRAGGILSPHGVS